MIAKKKKVTLPEGLTREYKATAKKLKPDILDKDLVPLVLKGKTKTEVYKDIEHQEMAMLARLGQVISLVTLQSPKILLSSSLNLKNLATTYGIMRDKVYPMGGMADDDSILGYLGRMFGTVQAEVALTIRGPLVSLPVKQAKILSKVAEQPKETIDVTPAQVLTSDNNSHNQ